MMPATRLKSVVLPQPDGPTIATNSPASTARSVGASPRVPPNRRSSPSTSSLGGLAPGIDRLASSGLVHMPPATAHPRARGDPVHHALLAGDRRQPKERIGFTIERRVCDKL